MRDALAELLRCWRAGQPVGLATVVRTWDSAPRPPGATLVVTWDGVVSGSVSGGCVESAVHDLAVAALDGASPALQRYGVSDDTALGVGLTCGGTIEIFVERCDPATFPELGEAAAAIDAGESIAVATALTGPAAGRHLLVYAERPGTTRRRSGSLGTERLDDAVADDALGLLSGGRSGVLGYGSDGERRGLGLEVFVASFAPAPRMIVFGATDYAVAAARIGAFLGYHVTVCDARATFARSQRFPDAANVVVDWPHRYLAGQVASAAVDERTVLCVLTHDPKFDVPLLEIALRLPVAYVGAMGSRRTHEQRLSLLADAGVVQRELSRLRSPIGLDLGARTPEETAVAIAAEIIALQWHGTGHPLRETAGPIHHPLLADQPPLVRPLRGLSDDQNWPR